MLAKVGGNFDVVEPELGRGAKRKWDLRARPLPQNMRLTPLEEGRQKLEDGYYDLALCHNFKDMKAAASFPVPIILVFHNKLSTELALGENSVERKKYLADVEPLAARAETMVFVSEAKRDDWGFGKGVVILPGLDPEDFTRYQGNIKKILRVGNRMKERDIMLGHTLHEKICDLFDTTLLGINPTLSASRPAESWEELKSHFAGHRLYLNCTLHPFEDGYNLAMLEAMATGAPVVSWGRPDSPITNEVDGFLSNDIGQIRAYITRLLGDIDLARATGAHGRDTVLEMFDIERFKASWGDAFNMTVKRRENRPIINKKRLNPYGTAYDTV